MNTKERSYWLIASGFVIMKLLIHFFTNTNYELHRDEMLYLAFGIHPAFGYASNPPLLGFFSWLIVHLHGYSEFWVRFIPALTGGIVVVLIAQLVKELRGGKMALVISCLAYLVSPVFLRVHSLYQPVCFDELFWVLITWLFMRMINTRDPRYWLWIGLASGVAFLNKYSVVFLLAGLVVSMILTPHRIMFRSRYFIHGLILGLMFILPNIIWQYLNNWPVVGHMKELYDTQLVHVTLISFLTGQILMLFSALPVWITGLLVFLVANSVKTYRFLAYTYIIVIILLILGKGKMYYSLGLYPFLLAGGGIALEKYLRGKWVIVNYLVMAFAVIFGFLILPYSLPVLPAESLARYCKESVKYMGSGAITWEDGKVHEIPQDYADMMCWKELAGLVVKAYNQLDAAEKEKCMIYAGNYGQAGAIQFYGRNNGLPVPICLSDSYLFWAPDTIGTGPLIDINDEAGDLDKLYENFTEVGRINNPFFRENGLRVYLCTGMKDYFKTFYSERVRKSKQKYLR
jgi:hypothetical protein